MSLQVLTCKGRGRALPASTLVAANVLSPHVCFSLAGVEHACDLFFPCRLSHRMNGCGLYSFPEPCAGEAVPPCGERALMCVFVCDRFGSKNVLHVCRCRRAIINRRRIIVPLTW